MRYSLLYDLLRLLIEILIVRGRGDARLRAEVLALRHQLGVLERQVGRPLWHPDDRLLLSAISQALPRSAWGIATAQPGDAAALASGAGAAEVGGLQTTATSATTVPNRRTRG